MDTGYGILPEAAAEVPSRPRRCRADDRFDVTWSHLTNLAMRIGPGTTECIIRLGCSGNIPGTAGLQLAGHRNFITMTVRIPLQ